ncbi:MAG: flagellar hook-basal body complex protein, partial [Acetobacteraceae bacterium]|nr:flagellar hook-basal body complex protein [Acetobacteraceae bacterium]
MTAASSPLSLAISGPGYFPVSNQNGTVGGSPTFDSRQLYTRAGDFKLDSSGYLVNSSGNFLNGWPADASGNIDQTKLTQLQVGQSGFAPVPTSSATIAANLPATPTGTTSYTTELPIVDAQGTPRNLELTWTKDPTAPNAWSLDIAQQGATSPIATVAATFGSGGNPNAPAGTLGSITTTGGTATTSTFAQGQNATISLNVDYGLGSQPISLNLGKFGGTDGVTQFAGST